MDETDFIRLVGQDYTLEILSATKYPQTANTLSDRLDIPIATTYRRLDELTKADLLREVSLTSETENSESTAYQRTIENVRIEFEEDSIMINSE